MGTRMHNKVKVDDKRESIPRTSVGIKGMEVIEIESYKTVRVRRVKSVVIPVARDLRLLCRGER